MLGIIAAVLEQDHLISLATALGEDVPAVNRASAAHAGK
jgi:4-diphosphocytidyl-2C-methyl-D-erythritol kinase